MYVCVCALSACVSLESQGHLEPRASSHGGTERSDSVNTLGSVFGRCRCTSLCLLSVFKGINDVTS